MTFEINVNIDKLITYLCIFFADIAVLYIATINFNKEITIGGYWSNKFIGLTLFPVIITFFDVTIFNFLKRKKVSITTLQYFAIFTINFIVMLIFKKYSAIGGIGISSLVIAMLLVFSISALNIIALLFLSRLKIIFYIK